MASTRITDEDEMVISFWNQEFANKQNGRLILEYPLISTTSTYSCRSMDGVVLLDEKKQINPEKGITTNLANKRIMVIQAKKHPLCASLIGQATLSPTLFRDSHPAYVEPVSLACSNEEDYKPILKAVEKRLDDFYDEIVPDKQIYSREIRYKKIGHRNCRASKFIPSRDNEKIERYFTINYRNKGAGTLIFNYPLNICKSKRKRKTEHNIILPDYGSGEILKDSREISDGALHSLQGRRVIAIQSVASSMRIGMWGLGLTICSVELIRHQFPTAQVSGVLLSKANDALLYPTIESNEDIEIIPKDIFNPARCSENPYCDKFSPIQ